ncbi:MarR family winged helix-turn-helix transcriptional regulator [Methylophaga sp.]|uniref:MarR family winged helix-turn-helix transcriptional regulator n=1 Tax=Methylophaga sp. TaxID=2024840 RepID=UPI003F697DD0
MDKRLCLSLYKAVNEIRRFYSALLDQYHLTYTQYLVLSVLWEREHIPLKEVMTRLKLDSGTLSPLIKRLQNAGLVIKSRCAKDERVVLLTLTDKARQLHPLLTMVEQRVTNQSALTSTEYYKLIEMLETVANSLSSEITK